MTIILAMSLPAEQAKDIIKLLLKLGATSAQASTDHFTAFHQVVAADNDEILDILVTNDRPVAMSILNNLGYSDRWGKEMDSPLATAVKKGYQDMTKKLLELGAKPDITFDDWIKVYIAMNSRAKNFTPEQNLKQYHSTVTQPIIAAAIKDLEKAVTTLVEHGADPSTLERNSWALFESNNRWQAGESVLDIIQKKLKMLREYKVSFIYFVTLDGINRGFLGRI